MLIKMKISFVLYLSAVMLLFVFGVRYFFTSEFSDYHAVAMALPWDSLSEKQQLTFGALYRGVGSGMLTTSLALGFLLFIWVRKKEKWALWGLTITGISFSSISFYNAFHFYMLSKIMTPWPSAMIGFFLIVIAYFISKDIE